MTYTERLAARRGTAVSRAGQKRDVRRTLQRAVERFAVEEARWYASLFDAAFLSAQSEAISTGDAEALAVAWLRQFGSTAATEGQLATVLPVARTFLEIYREAGRGA